MKYRNRVKHGFKRIKRQEKVFEYITEKLINKKSFLTEDISRDLSIPKTTVIELLNELNEKGKITYKKGIIYVEGLGNNRDIEDVKVTKMPKTTKSRIEKKNRVYNYLVELAKENKPIPNLTGLGVAFNDMHLTTLMTVLKELDKDEKIIYRKGRIIAVNVPSVRSTKEKEIKYAKQEETYKDVKVTDDVIEEPYVECKGETDMMSDIQLDFKDKYDRAVKDLIAEYILNADITSKEDIITYVETLMKITDKLKEKLF